MLVLSDQQFEYLCHWVWLESSHQPTPKECHGRGDQLGQLAEAFFRLYGIPAHHLAALAAPLPLYQKSDDGMGFPVLDYTLGHASISSLETSEVELAWPWRDGEIEEQIMKLRLITETPWPHLSCPWCGKVINDVFAQCLNILDKKQFSRLVFHHPGVPFACPFCSNSLEFGETDSLVKSSREPYRHRKACIEAEAQILNMTVEQYLGTDRQMPGAFGGSYRWA